ncbi:hypothetical protein [Mangrovibacterium lignilyticum]|uniref:hypothetical protein n=1 Tax=Mangrovibacterium lignilyticum TaxID=2668052 RepID=UPI0013D44B92|nr:hypothetical protein [Mangrovibacterium lignilyticum]
MDRTFTWFEFLVMSEDDLSESVGELVNAEQIHSSDKIEGPASKVLDNIRKFAETYDTVETKSIGFVEFNLN